MYYKYSDRMNNIFKKYTQKYTQSENIDFFTVQLFAVFTTTFFITLLVLHLQQPPSTDESMQRVASFAQHNSGSKTASNKRIHTAPVVQASKKINTKNETLYGPSGNTEGEDTQNIASVASDETLKNNEKALAKEDMASLLTTGSAANNHLQAGNSSNLSNQKSGAIAVNGASPFTNGSTINAGLQVSSLSPSQNATINPSVSSATGRQNNQRAGAGASSNRANSINSQQNPTAHSQTSSQHFDNEGQAREVLGVGATNAGVTNGTRLDSSVRRDCPPLDRFQERDRDRVITIQRSIGCII